MIGVKQDLILVDRELKFSPDFLLNKNCNCCLAKFIFVEQELRSIMALSVHHTLAQERPTCGILLVIPLDSLIPDSSNSYRLCRPDDPLGHIFSGEQPTSQGYTFA